MAKHRPQSPTRGRWLVLQMLQPKGPHGPCRQQASNSYGVGGWGVLGVRGQVGGPTSK